MRKAFFRRSVLCQARRGRGGLILLLVLALACGSKTPEEQLLKAVQPVGSWLASLEMTGRKWNANSVPAAFVRSISKAARKEFEKAAEETGKSAARAELREPIRKLLAEAGDAEAGLVRAVEQGDRAAAAREVGRFAALRARFEALTRGAEGS
jgi:hypothetical protein